MLRDLSLNTVSLNPSRDGAFTASLSNLRQCLCGATVTQARFQPWNTVIVCFIVYDLFCCILHICTLIMYSARAGLYNVQGHQEASGESTDTISKRLPQSSSVWTWRTRGFGFRHKNAAQVTLGVPKMFREFCAGKVWLWGEEASSFPCNVLSLCRWWQGDLSHLHEVIVLKAPCFWGHRAEKCMEPVALKAAVANFGLFHLIFLFILCHSEPQVLSYLSHGHEGDGHMCWQLRYPWSSQLKGAAHVCQPAQQ